MNADDTDYSVCLIRVNLCSSVAEFLLRFRSNAVLRPSIALMFAFTCAYSLVAAEKHPAPLPIPEAEAKTQAEMKPYTELIEHTDAKIEMVPIRGGKFTMGSPDSEKGRYPDEGPQHEVEISPFWMAKCEITWDAYEVWMSDLDILRRQLLGGIESPRDKFAEQFQLSQPTKPYTDM